MELVEICDRVRKKKERGEKTKHEILRSLVIWSCGLYPQDKCLHAYIFLIILLDNHALQ